LRFSDVPVVCLHSTGLDSTAGLATRLRDSPAEQVIPVLVRHQIGQSGLALKQAGIVEPRENYKFDLFGPPRPDEEVPAAAMASLKVFLMQVSNLSGLDTQTEVPWFFRRHLVGTGVVEDGQPLTPFANLYRRYRKEWLSLVAKAQAQGWSWANLLAPRKVAV
jgi:hypothetical protein